MQLGRVHLGFQKNSAILTLVWVELCNLSHFNLSFFESFPPLNSCIRVPQQVQISLDLYLVTSFQIESLSKSNTTKAWVTFCGLKSGNFQRVLLPFFESLNSLISPKIPATNTPPSCAHLVKVWLNFLEKILISSKEAIKWFEKWLVRALECF